MRILIAVISMLLLHACVAVAFPEMGRQGSKTSQVLQLDGYRVTIEYDERNEKVARYVADICGRSLPDLMKQLGLEELAAMQIIIVPRMREFRSPGGPDYPEWGAAFAFMERQVMVIDVEKAVKTWNSLDQTVIHELSHLLLAQRVGPVPMPAWFLEGLAQWQAQQGSLTDSWHLMNAVWSRNVPTLMQITIQFPRDEGGARNAYRLSLAAFKKLFEGDHQFPVSVPLFLDDIAANGEFDAALVAFRGQNLHQFSSYFMQDLVRKYSTHLLLFQEGPLFSLLAVLFVFMIVSVKLRTRRKMKRLEMEERGL